MHKIFISLTATLLAACSYQAPAPSAGEPYAGLLMFTASPPQASAGSVMALTLSNGSQQAIGYNLCTSALQNASGAPVQTDRVCTMELRTLQPGQTANYNYELPRNLASGSYRFSTGIEWMQSGSQTTLTSNLFEVR